MDVCIRCNKNPVSPRLASFRGYCEECWNIINEKKSHALTGIKRSIDTRARMAASHKVNKVEDSKLWKIYFDFFKEQLEKQERFSQELNELAIRS